MFILLYGLFAYVVMVPLMLYATWAESGQKAWGGASVPPQRAPVALRFTAWSCCVLGSLIGPGVVLCVALMAVFLTGVALLPSLLVAWRQLVAGRAILRRDAGAPRECRTLSTLAGGLNLLVALVIAAISIVFWEQRSSEGIVIVSAISIIVLLSLAQAVLLRRAASLLDGGEQGASRAATA